MYPYAYHLNECFPKDLSGLWCQLKWKHWGWVAIPPYQLLTASHRQSLEALSDDNLHGCKSSDRKHPRKLRKYQGVPVKSFMEAAACGKGKKPRMRQKHRERERRGRSQREAEVGGRELALTWPALAIGLLSRWIVESLRSPIVAQISDNDLCLAMIAGDRYWQARWPVSVMCQ